MEHQPTVHELSYAGEDDEEDYDDGEEEDKEALVIPSAGSSRSTQPTSHSSNALAVPAGSLSETHQKALYEAQLALQTRDERIRQLEIENAQAKQAGHHRRSTKARKGDSSADRSEESHDHSDNPQDAVEKELRPYLETIKTYSRKYSACYRPWPPPDQTWELSARPDVNPQDPRQRYPTTGSAEQKHNALVAAHAAELYDLFPSVLHPYINNRWVIRVFKSAVRDQKSKIVCNARILRQRIFADLPELNMSLFDDMAGNAQAISTDPILTQWRSVPEDIYPPIIFPQGKAGQMKYIFRCSAIANFTRVAILGKGALPRNGKFRPRSNTSAKQWDVTRVSAGMIAFAAVAVRYLLSLEADFDHVGSVTGVNHEYLFDQYLKLLHVSWESPRIVQTRAWLEERIFKGLNKDPPSAAPSANPGVRTYVELDDLDELNDPGSDSDTDNADSGQVVLAASVATPVPFSIDTRTPAVTRPSVPEDLSQHSWSPPELLVSPPPRHALVPTPPFALPLSEPLPTVASAPVHVPQPILLPADQPVSSYTPPPASRPASRPAPRPVHRSQPSEHPLPTSQSHGDFNDAGPTSAPQMAASVSQYANTTPSPAVPADLSGALADTLQRVSLTGNDPIAQDPVAAAPTEKRKRGGQRRGAGRGRGAIQIQEAQLEAEADPAAVAVPEPRRRTTRVKK